MNPLDRYRRRAGHGALAALARETGIAKSTLTSIARGDREPTLAQARALDLATQGACAFADWQEKPGADGSSPANIAAAS